jgi:hypothetical protein
MAANKYADTKAIRSSSECSSKIRGCGAGDADHLRLGHKSCRLRRSASPRVTAPRFRARAAVARLLVETGRRPIPACWHSSGWGPLYPRSASTSHQRLFVSSPVKVRHSGYPGLGLLRRIRSYILCASRESAGTLRFEAWRFRPEFALWAGQHCGFVASRVGCKRCDALR